MSGYGNGKGVVLAPSAVKCYADYRRLHGAAKTEREHDGITFRQQKRRRTKRMRERSAMAQGSYVKRLLHDRLPRHMRNEPLTKEIFAQ